MNSYERIKMLLNKEIPDRMGIYEHFWSETINDVWPEQGYPKDINPYSYFDFDITFCGEWVNTDLFPWRKEILQETPDWQLVKDGRGATLKFWKNKSGTPEHVGFEITSEQKWKQNRDRLKEFNIDRLGDLEKLRNELSEARKKGKFAVFGNMSFIELLRATVGDENFLPAMLTEPQWIEDFCQVYLEFFLKHYEKLFELVSPPDGFWLYEDLAYSNGLFCSPDILAKIIIPYEKKFVSFLKDYGLPVIIHTCGNVKKALPLIIEAGFDCLQPMEAKAGMHIIELAKLYKGSLSFMGNINVVALNSNDKAIIHNEIVPKLEYVKNLRLPYIFHSDHSVPPTVSFESYQYALGLYLKHGKY